MKLLEISLLRSTVLAGTFGLLGAVAAQAGTYTVPFDLNPTPQIVLATDFSSTPFTFTDTFSFNISGSNNDFALSATIDPLSSHGTSILNIIGLSGVIDNASHTQVGVLAFSPSDSNFEFNGALGNGSYSLIVSGTTVGSAGGAYTASFAASPVPEASTALSAIAGLGLMALITRRRRFN